MKNVSTESMNNNFNDLESFIEANETETDEKEFDENLLLSQQQALKPIVDPSMFPIKLKEWNTLKSQTDKFLRLISEIDKIELWHDQSGKAFITSTLAQAHGTWELNNKGSDLFLQKLWFLQTGRAVSPSTLKTVVRDLEMKAIFGTNHHDSAMRLHGDYKTVYVDLGNADWDVVKIDANGWSIVSGFDNTVRFYRSNGCKELPLPMPGGDLNDLRKLVNAADDETWALIVAWLLGAYAPKGSYAGLIINGSHGNAKSTASRFLQALVDPNFGELRVIPKTSRDIAVAAQNSRLLAYDNLSGLSKELADIFCSISTRGSFVSRKLYTNTQESSVTLDQPWLMNGIDSISNRLDLLSRSIVINLQVIPRSEMKSDEELNNKFNQLYPYLLGALYDAISESLRNYNTIQLHDSTRMRDFCHWVVAGEQALGLPVNDLLTTILKNRDDVLDAVLGDDGYVGFLTDLLQQQNRWEGTSQELLAEQVRYLDKHKFPRKGWPDTPQGIGVRLNRSKALLNRRGITFDRMPRTRESRLLVIEWDEAIMLDDDSAPQATPSENASKEFSSNLFWENNDNEDSA